MGRSITVRLGTDDEHRVTTENYFGYRIDQHFLGYAVYRLELHILSRSDVDLRAFF
jgi:hypothetical protein